MTDSVTFEIQSLFHQGAYNACITLVKANSSGTPSSSPTLERLLYAARSHIALGQASNALSLLPASLASASPAARAVRALAGFVQAQDAGKDADEFLVELRDTLDDAVLNDPAGEIVRVAAATAMVKDQDPVGALETLGMGSASSREIECIALGIHILLSIHRPDLALKEFNAARIWADDSLLIQLIEAYLGLYNGGRGAQQAYYVYDELAQNPAHAGKESSVPSLVGKGVSQLVTANTAGAKEAFAEAEALDANNPDMLANSAVLAAQSGSAEEFAAHLTRLRNAAPSHALVTGFDEAGAEFDLAAARHAEALEAVA